MATTTGLVQHLGIHSRSTCAFIGPSPATTAIFSIAHRDNDTAAIAAFKAVMVDALGQALASRREVTVEHGDSDSRIEGLTLR